jgi:uncharacterized protein GlcG (DUF336 family)
MQAIGLQEGERLVAAAFAKAAAEFHRPICVAVCDTEGFLLAFARGDGAPVRSIQISQGKAYSAARLGVNTDAFLERLHRENIAVGYFCDDRLTALPGGAVLKNSGGKVLGGVGISGLTSAEDQSIACALAELLAKDAVS